MPFWPSRNSMEHLQNESGLLRALRRDRFSVVDHCGDGVKPVCSFAPRAWPGAIDWHTIITLSGLMLLTKGVELSGYFDVLGRKMTRRFHTERQLAMFPVLAAAVLSTFLTNDVALFIVVPLTITLKTVRDSGQPIDYF